MDDRQINDQLAQLRRYKRETEDLKEKIAAIEAAVKAEMEAREVEEITTENYRVTWKSVTGVRLDAKALKAERPEIYDRYAVATQSRRFLVS